MRRGRYLLSVTIALVAIIGVACGQGNFNGGEGQTIGRMQPEPRHDIKPTLGETSGTQMTTALNFETIQQMPGGPSIAKCLQEWGNHPFDQSAALSPKRVNATASTLGRTVTQDPASDRVELVLVTISSSMLGAVQLDLKNPKGWYCIDSDSQTLGSTVVNVACGAQIANHHSQSGTLGSTQINGC